ncbi:penicillin-binding protein 2 [Sunxiuqinia sp. sy24]|uniref:penicillin-binding protein 2 n=1 Tax=Sunxiuqinia sp. sy24 TaxID=3461495 RepID=UPI0040461924
MDNFSKRKYLLGAIFILVALIFTVRLFRLQVLENNYKQYATRNVLRRVITYPARGLIYDRNGELLVYNKASYDLLVTPREVSAFDTTSFCRILDIDKAELVESLQKAKKYSTYKPSVIIKQLSPENYAVLQEKIFRFPGFFVQARTLREYPQKTAAHVLGYVGEVDRSKIENDPYYTQGDYIGVIGLEKAYEEALRGQKGVNFQLVDVHNRIKGSYREGRSDTVAVLGKNLSTTLDADLQAYAEYLMQNKKGSVVAIEPATGEVLAFLSAPTYDPSLLVGRSRGANFKKLQQDTLEPIFNRAIRAAYPPGSTFKLINALIGLEEQAITTHSAFSCSGRGSRPIRCTHDHYSPISLRDAIRESCNPFFWNTFSSIIRKYPRADEGYNTWRNHLLTFGLGQRLGTELGNELSGNIPKDSYYNFYYGERHWNALTVRSLAIGQGELSITPFQLANLAVTIANRGYYITPHLVKSVWSTKDEPEPIEFERHNTSIAAEHFDVVIEGMQAVVEESNVRYTSKLDSTVICGKTGTVQNPHGSDHSVFIAFAPKENPKIAISVYVENGVWGSRYAAPIASLIIEKYLNNSIAPRRLAIEERMRNANLLNPNQPK